MRISLVPAQWPGDILEDVVQAVRWGTAARVNGIWSSEVAGFDAVGLAVALAPAAGGAEILVGPVSPAVRDPALYAMGLATVAAVATGPVLAVLGSSSPTIVSRWHGRPSSHPRLEMETAVRALRAIAAGERTDQEGGDVRSRGFVLRVARPSSMEIVIAAQGPRMLRLAGAIADRVVINLVTPEQATEMVSEVAEGAASAGRPTPPVAAWVAAGSVDASRERVAELLKSYVRAPGYAERFAQAGIVVDGRLVPSAADQLAVFGDADAVARRIGEYRAAGLAEVALIVSGKDPTGMAIIDGAAAACRDWSGQ